MNQVNKNIEAGNARGGSSKNQQNGSETGVNYLGENNFRINKMPTANNVDFSVLGGDKPSISSETL
jgi:hypothetical protein